MSVKGTPLLEWTAAGSRVALEVIPFEVLGALNRLRTRLMQGIDALTPEQAEAPTRCAEWRAVDLVNHLCDTTGWAVDAITAAAESRSTALFDDFHVRATPKQLTDGADRRLDAARARLHEIMAANLRQVPGVVAVRDRLTDTPIGPQPFPVAAQHVLWDTWLHERDLLIPLGIQPPQHEDEVRLSAIYTLRMIGYMTGMLGRELSVALRLHGATSVTLQLDAGRGSTVVRILESAGDATRALSGDAATIVDALTGRGDIAAALDGPQEMREALGSLARALAG
jgi:uncharacterized protein (TIGR03083 family)